jgi:polysaccharide export outer membrane protein
MRDASSRRPHQRSKGLIIALALLAQSTLICMSHARPPNKAYLIGPRDVIVMAIYAGGEKQQEVELTVSSRGKINVPFIGALKAEGMTLSQLEVAVTKPLARDYFVDPLVNIAIKEYHSLQYYISGAVKEPGLFEMRSRSTLLELIAKAGGVLPERGNVAYILRDSTEQVVEGEDVEDLISNREPLKVDLKSLLDRGNMRHNVTLKSGDVVYIPLQTALNLGESKVYVEGEVKEPGVYDYRPGLTAMNACIMAGGFDKFAAPNRTRIIRADDEEKTIIKINLNDVKKGEVRDIELKPGDRIHVPESWF